MLKSNVRRSVANSLKQIQCVQVNGALKIVMKQVEKRQILMVESAELKDIFFVRVFKVSCVSLVQPGKTVDCHFVSKVHNNTRYPGCMKLFMHIRCYLPLVEELGKGKRVFSHTAGRVWSNAQTCIVHMICQNPSPTLHTFLCNLVKVSEIPISFVSVQMLHFVQDSS